MRHVLGVIGVLAVTAFLSWLKWSQAQGQDKDVGDGGIQTLFDKDSSSPLPAYFYRLSAFPRTSASLPVWAFTASRMWMYSCLSMRRMNDFGISPSRKSISSQ